MAQIQIPDPVPQLALDDFAELNKLRIVADHQSVIDSLNNFKDTITPGTNDAPDTYQRTTQDGETYTMTSSSQADIDNFIGEVNAVTSDLPQFEWSDALYKASFVMSKKTIEGDYDSDYNNDGQPDTYLDILGMYGDLVSTAEQNAINFYSLAMMYDEYVDPELFIVKMMEKQGFSTVYQDPSEYYAAVGWADGVETDVGGDQIMMTSVVAMIIKKSAYNPFDKQQNEEEDSDKDEEYEKWKEEKWDSEYHTFDNYEAKVDPHRPSDDEGWEQFWYDFGMFFTLLFSSMFAGEEEDGPEDENGFEERYEEELKDAKE